ncbi:hypothetical protein [Burkholderia sp. Ax-1724]|uniref:hypothetical protein n=1 Tax=Burkholderia sp. Ax-1724 TaxID=2608336 RepID=UPI0014211B7B|nr:hypothetical protein [Burkholderia sp. Ax-1724]NIF51429.1 hypothetical protein [Burkholderia sp. Ax-1724]
MESQNAEQGAVDTVRLAPDQVGYLTALICEEYRRGARGEELARVRTELVAEFRALNRAAAGVSD